MKYACYIPWKFYPKKKKDGTLWGKIHNFTNDELHMKSLWKNVDEESEEDCIIYRHKKKVFAILIPQEAYKHKNIIPVIEDITKMQCFAAASLNWIEIEDPETDASAEYVQNVYHKNVDKIHRIVDKTFKNIFNKKFAEYKMCADFTIKSNEAVSSASA